MVFKILAVFSVVMMVGSLVALVVVNVAVLVLLVVLIELISEEALLILGFLFLLLLVWVLDHSWCSTVLTVAELLMTLLEIM